MPEIGDRFARRLGHQSPRLLSWTCTKQPQQWTYDAFFKNIKLHVPRHFVPPKSSLGNHISPPSCRLKTVLYLHWTTLQGTLSLHNFTQSLWPVGDNVENLRGECALVSSGGGSEDDEESGDSDDEGAGEETGGDKSGDGNGEASNERDSGDSEDEHTRTPQTGTYSPLPMHRRTSPSHAPSTSYVRQGQTSGPSLTRAEVEELLLDQRTLIEIRLRTIKLDVMQHVTDEFVKVRDFISTLVLPSLCRSTPSTAQATKEPTILGSLLHDGNGGETDPVPKCAKPQGRAGMKSELAMIGDDDEVASGGSGKREDDRVASPTGVAEVESGCGMDFEPEKDSDDDEVPSGGSENRQDKLIASASGVAEVDGGATNMPGTASIPVQCNDPPTTKRP
ncbi:Hypothetical predicted protein [Olea europaea subsp. europaea]|uniref:Uncharacterized protein n=1 Tax=Olea europaea subsp. europaea TaxID=158383 RepID=A0A8S0TQJ6_OLEEU|nr:Hypothetical predicted protein [Olea europaea subsp. europaea]